MVGSGYFTFIFAVVPVNGVESRFPVDAALVEKTVQGGVVCISADGFINDLCFGKFGTQSFQQGDGM